jgi:hypothetical protein
MNDNNRWQYEERIREFEQDIRNGRTWTAAALHASLTGFIAGMILVILILIIAAVIWCTKSGDYPRGSLRLID